MNPSAHPRKLGFTSFNLQSMANLPGLWKIDHCESFVCRSHPDALHQYKTYSSLLIPQKSVDPKLPDMKIMTHVEVWNYKHKYPVFLFQTLFLVYVITWARDSLISQSKPLRIQPRFKDGFILAFTKSSNQLPSNALHGSQFFQIFDYINRCLFSLFFSTYFQNLFNWTQLQEIGLPKIIYVTFNFLFNFRQTAPLYPASEFSVSVFSEVSLICLKRHWEIWNNWLLYSSVISAQRQPYSISLNKFTTIQSFNIHFISEFCYESPNTIHVPKNKEPCLGCEGKKPESVLRPP